MEGRFIRHFVLGVSAHFDIIESSLPFLKESGMSTFILMKIWETDPHTYDRKIRRYFGRDLTSAYDRLIDCVQEGQRLLDLGCGTGSLCLRAAEKGARVKGIDISREMLVTARRKAEEKHLSGLIEFEEKGVAELDEEKDGQFDAVMCGLFLSELSPGELSFCLTEIWRVLKSGGLFLIADETKPRSIGKKFQNTFLRFFLKILVFLRTGRTTRALVDFPGRLERVGFQVISARLNARENMIELVATK
jgi:ubiquinone/menaquinone biosynthesis C-methylase UbiE